MSRPPCSHSVGRSRTWKRFFSRSSREATPMATTPNLRAMSRATGEAQSRLARLAGPIALAAGALMTVQQLVMYPIVDRSHLIATMAHPLFVPSAIAYVVALCGLLIALVAVYTWQANRAGAFGLIGFVAALVGTLFLAGDAWFEAFAVPWGLAIAWLGVWMLRTSKAARAIAEPALH